MTLRSVNPYTSYQVLLDLQRTKDQLANLQEQLASGNRLNRLGDDPTASSLVLDFQNSIEKNKAYIQQANSATSFLSTTETSLQSVNDVISRLLELGQQGLNDITSPAGRTALAHEVDGLRTNLLAIANTQAQGKYIFAGTRTTTQPFSGPAAGPIAYAGDGNSIDLDVANSTSVSTNLTGEAVFFGGPTNPVTFAGANPAADLFQQVTDLRDGLTTNNRAQIQTAYDNLKTIMARVNDQMTDLGGRQASLDQLRENVGSYNLSLQTIQGSYQDLDYAAAITDYNQADTAQQASLSVLAKTSQRNLLDYLG